MNTKSFVFSLFLTKGTKVQALCCSSHAIKSLRVVLAAIDAKSVFWVIKDVQVSSKLSDWAIWALYLTGKFADVPVNLKKFGVPLGVSL